MSDSESVINSDNHTAWRELRRTAPFVRPYYPQLLVMAVALVIATLAILGMGHGVRMLVDQGFTEASRDALHGALRYVMGLTLVFAAATYLRFFLITKIGERVIADIRYSVFRHLLAVSPYFFETQKTGEVISRMTSDLTVLQVVIGSSLSVALRHSLLLIGGLALMVITSPGLTLYIVVIIPLIVLPILLLGKKVRLLSRNSQRKIAALSAHVEEMLFGIKTVQAYTQEETVAGKFKIKVDEAFDAAMGRVRVRALLIATVIFLSFGAIALLIGIGGNRVISGEMSAGQLSAFLFYAVIVASSFGNIAQVIGDVQRAAGAAHDLMDLLDIASTVREPSQPNTLSLKTSRAGPITFENVSFSYPTKPGSQTLEHLNFTVEPGQTVALVGPSGAGKTTVLQLLLRFYDPDSGRILIQETPIDTLRLSDLRNHFAYVTQDPLIFSATLHENIAFSNPHASEEDIRKAAEAARVMSFADALPHGMQTYLGEKGVRLSGGERQRVAIARAMLKNPPILLLDEATSALDAENEGLVQEALHHLTRNRTTILIAHRLATVRNADNIIVLDNGKVMAQGTHGSLMKSNELYARLAKLQFLE